MACLSRAGAVVCLIVAMLAIALPSVVTAQPAGFTSVTSFGAVPNDGVDDLNAFNAAYAAATVGVWIPPGTFHLRTHWAIARPNIKIQGAGIVSTKLYFMNQGTMNTGILATTTNTEISHFYIDSANTTRDDFPGKGIMGTYGTNSWIHDLEIHHCETGMWIGGYSSPLQVTTGLRITNNRIIDNWADGINLAQGTSNTTVDHNYLSGNRDDGIALWPSNDFGAPNEVNNIISNNTIENNLRAGGIGIFGGNGHQVFGNIIRNSTGCSGIRFTSDFPGWNFTQTTQISVHDNTMTNVGTPTDFFGCSRGAIEINATNGPVNGIQFTNNTIINAQRHGVQLGSTGSVTNVTFNGLTIDGVGTSGVTTSCFTVPIQSFGIMTYGNSGNVTFTNVSMRNIPVSQLVYQTNPMGFPISVSYGPGSGPTPTPGPTARPTATPTPTNPPTATATPTTPPPGSNIALGKAISASSAQQNFVAANANDNSVTTYWEGAPNTYPNTLTVNLGGNFNIGSVVVKLNPDPLWRARTQTIQVLGHNTSTSTFSNLVSAASYSFNPSTNSNTVTIPVSATVSEIRLQITANSGAGGGQAAELQVITAGGSATPTPTPTATPQPTATTPPRATVTPTTTPTATPPAGPSNLAIGKAISASSTQQNYVAANANDNSATTYWEAAPNTYPNTLTVALGANHNITSVVVKLNPDPIWGPRTQTIQVLGHDTSTATFSNLVGSATYTFNPSTNSNSVTIPVTANVSDVRLSITANSGATGGQAAELQIIGN